MKNKPTKRVSEKQAGLKMSGTCTVEEAGRMRALLTEHLQGADRVVICLSDVGEADLSFLQLLCAAHKSAFYAKKTLVLEGVLSEPLARKAHEAGFACHGQCDADLNKDCLWAGV